MPYYYKPLLIATSALINYAIVTKANIDFLEDIEVLRTSSKYNKNTYI